MTYYDQTFEPYKTVGDKCIVADESEWEKLGPLNDQSEFRDDDAPRPVVKVLTDIFEDADDPVVDSQGSSLHESYDPRVKWTTIKRFDGRLRSPIKPVEVVSRTFKTISLTKNVDYLIETQHPNRDALPMSAADGSGKRSQYKLENVILAVPVETQADIERRIPELLKCHALCKALWVICNPKERLDFRKFIDGFECDFCGPIIPDFKFDGRVKESVCPNCFTDFDDAGSTITSVERKIIRIIVEGGEHPIHPKWLRYLRDQCKDIVPFHFAGWGDWVPSTQLSPLKLAGINRSIISQGTRYTYIGRERAIRLLDGVEHNGIIS